MQNRNPIIQIGQLKIKLLGDVHLGREFKEAVPLHRRGEREKMIWNQFRSELDHIEECDLLVQVGDLFDKMEVSNRLLLDTADALISTANHCHKEIIILRGNHDASRDQRLTSSFDVLDRLIGNERFIKLIREPWGKLYKFSAGDVYLGFVPWDPFLTAKELVEKLSNITSRYHAVFGHWDIEDFGKPNDNLIPLESLSKITNKVFTGHIHTPKAFQHSKCEVSVVGSMQPYSFGEDPDGMIYQTYDLEQLQNTIAGNPDSLKNKCIRVKLQEGEELPDIDCLQLRSKKIEQDENDSQLDTNVEFEAFDFKKLFDEAFFGIDIDIKEEIWNRYNLEKGERDE